MIKIKVPGKLYIAGEYAVVEAGYPAILVTIDRFIYFTLNQTLIKGSLTSKNFQETPLVWTRNANMITFSKPNNAFKYVIAAIKVTEKYAMEQHVKLKYFDLNIKSELDSPDGKKFGLGSSAAVTVGTVKILNKFYDLHLTLEQIFKLAALAHFYVQGNGSLGDIAAITYEGWIAYYSFDRQWLKNTHFSTISALISHEWPQLKIFHLKAPKSLTLLVGWSGTPASTSHLLKTVKNKDLYEYYHFITQSKKCVETLIQAFKCQNIIIIQEQIIQNRNLLLQLSKTANMEIETPRLKELIEIAHHYHAVAKTSGAGGGDCGIAFATSQTDIPNLLKTWKHKKILPLDLKTYREEQ